MAGGARGRGQSAPRIIGKSKIPSGLGGELYAASGRYFDNIYPQQDHGKRYISVDDVDALAESPRHLPARFANKLYENRESGMGYTIFTVVFADGCRQAYATGNALDFIRYPEGKGRSDVVDVLPHEGRNAEPISSPEYYWRLYAD